MSAEEYLLRCQRYIELNPVRAGMVTDPAKYTWSSYRHHALGERKEIIREHECVMALGQTATERQNAYRGLFRSELDEEAIAEIRKAANQGRIGQREIPGRSRADAGPAGWDAETREKETR